MKNKPESGIRGYGTYVIVSLAFLALLGSLQALIWLYWDTVLEPRLRREAASQADVLAHSQAARLADALVVADPVQRLQSLRETIAEALLFTGPQTNQPLFLGLSLEIDYDVVSAPAGSLNLVHGISYCSDCFLSEVALYSPRSDELLGIARFRVNNDLFRNLSKDVKKTLFTQSHVGIVLLLSAWGFVLILIREINRSRRQAEAANRAKSTFLANMSHELRTPLNAIIGFSELMQRDPDFSPKHRENLSVINRSGNYLLELINDVLELSRIEAAQIHLNETTFDIYEMLDGVVKMMRLRVEKKNLRFIFERMEDIPRYVRTDERKLRQILLNLLGNAIKFTEQGCVVLRVSREDGESDPSSELLILRFEVEDTGPGIPSEERNRIFDAFTQARSGYDKKEGAGLGLTISRQFVENLGGEISVDSSVGAGTVFRFTIRAVSAAASTVEAHREARTVIGLKHQTGSGNDQPYRILVVDDHEENRSLLRMLLEPVGFLVRTAENGRQAVDIDDTWKPDLIWMDMRMPVMDGYEATKRIRKTERERGRNRPIIIALTAGAFREDRDAVLAAGCDDFVRRPFRESEIWEKMHKHLGVEFVYGEPESQESEQTLDDNTITESVDSLSADLRLDFKNAVESIDFEKAMVVIGRIQKEDERLASFLKELVNAYQFDVLQRLFEMERRN